MIKLYDYNKDKNIQLSEHFKVKEFLDEKISGLIDDDLIYYLECIYARCHASKIIITSGYRSKEEDLRVGGNGYGFHTKGMAVDFIVFDKYNKVIPTSYVFCVAYELGLQGIGLISNSACHIDLRKNSYWYGDERTNYHINNPYNYFDLTFKEVLTYLM